MVSNVSKIIPERVKEFWYNYRTALKESKRKEEDSSETGVGVDVDAEGWGVKEADEKNRTEASMFTETGPVPGDKKTDSHRSLGLATQLALAYAIHKSFIFIRVPLAAAITPKVVKVLRSWGWQIGKRRTKV